jgi:hypothetical protein
VLGVVFRILCMACRALCVVRGVGGVDMHRLCFSIAMYLVCMGIGGGAGMPLVVRWEGVSCVLVWAATQKLSEERYGDHMSVCGRRVRATACT